MTISKDVSQEIRRLIRPSTLKDNDYKSQIETLPISSASKRRESTERREATPNKSNPSRKLRQFYDMTSAISNLPGGSNINSRDNTPAKSGIPPRSSCKGKLSRHFYDSVERQVEEVNYSKFNSVEVKLSPSRSATYKRRRPQNSRDIFGVTPFLG
eukprot:TRINITY_DN5970_c0_g1_i2.p1 TRINITY_DN5970_c0_g1~~TRINITY_DN5970_c0_g1_i2.p1  ORF type:complete len:156 (+),score=20.34 TRINITY_DN5970_c0_g1_i2:397-864(+)